MKSLKSVSLVAIGAAIGVLVGGSFVWAHGGDTNLVHGCVYSGGQHTSYNVRIVGAGESCPAGSSPVDWSIAGPAGPAGAPGAAGAPGPAGPPTPKSEIRSEIVGMGIPRRTIRVVEESTGTNALSYKTVTAWCPASHALLVSGGFTTAPTGPIPPTFRAELSGVLFNARTTSGSRQGWKVTIARYAINIFDRRKPRQPWRLTSRAECADTS
jgi:hypothetical protein